ncbi:MAG: hypothetical protein ACYDH6_16855 [Acidimicrobiales bacterium]
MVRSRIAPLLTVVVVAAFAAGACSSTKKSSSSAASATTVAPADKTAFCDDNAKLDKAAANASDEASTLAAFKANVALIDDFGAKAPVDIKVDAQVLVDGAHKVIAANSLTNAGLDAKAFDAAGTKVNAYCGQNPDGTPATTTTVAPATSSPSTTA